PPPSPHPTRHRHPPPMARRTTRRPSPHRRTARRHRSSFGNPRSDPTPDRRLRQKGTSVTSTDQRPSNGATAAAVYTFVPRPRSPEDADDPPPAGQLIRMTDRAVYTVKEVARMLSLSLCGTYALVRDGTIPALKMGNRWIVPKRRFHAWLDGLTEQPE